MLANPLFLGNCIPMLSSPTPSVVMLAQFPERLPWLVGCPLVAYNFTICYRHIFYQALFVMANLPPITVFLSGAANRRTSAMPLHLHRHWVDVLSIA
mmetsp:Transcript_74632/g.155623  ORF Transcript_74632/g.155623 Transcript_74632/m.155623 type:complete len:97 (-) Transcript_74632:23-313(-)